jgi:hypothetical protein
MAHGARGLCLPVARRPRAGAARGWHALGAVRLLPRRVALGASAGRAAGRGRRVGRRVARRSAAVRHAEAHRRRRRAPARAHHGVERREVQVVHRSGWCRQPLRAVGWCRQPLDGAQPPEPLASRLGGPGATLSTRRSTRAALSLCKRSGRALRLWPGAGRTIFVRSLLFDPLPSLLGGAPSAAAMRRRALRALAALSHAPPCAAPPPPRLPPPLAAAPPRRAFSSDASDEPHDEPLLSAMDRLRMSLDLQGIKRNAVPAHVGVQRAPMLIPFCHVGGALLGMRGTGCWQRGHQHTTGSLFGARRPPFGPLHAAWRRRRPDRARRGVRWCQLLGFGIAGLRGAGPRCFSADPCFGCGSPALAASPGAGLRRSRPRPPTPPCGRRPPSWGCRRRCGLLARERQGLAGTPNPPLL